MPSQKSLEKQQYYAYPQNTFWWIMSQVLGFDINMTYVKRVQAMVESRVAVWDVLMDCDRPGSLDSNIVKGSEKVNDFDTLMNQVTSIKLIAFNGGAAKQLFMRHCNLILDTCPTLKWVQLPSTSSAHATMTKTQKLQIWQEALSFQLFNSHRLIE